MLSPLSSHFLFESTALRKAYQVNLPIQRCKPTFLQIQARRFFSCSTFAFAGFPICNYQRNSQNRCQPAPVLGPLASRPYPPGTSRMYATLCTHLYLLLHSVYSLNDFDCSSVPSSRTICSRFLPPTFRELCLRLRLLARLDIHKIASDLREAMFLLFALFFRTNTYTPTIISPRRLFHKSPIRSILHIHSLFHLLLNRASKYLQKENTQICGRAGNLPHKLGCNSQLNKPLYQFGVIIHSLPY